MQLVTAPYIQLSCTGVDHLPPSLVPSHKRELGYTALFKDDFAEVAYMSEADGNR